MQSPDSLSSSIHAALDIAIEQLGGTLVPLMDAARRLGWRCQSRAAVLYRLRRGTLPVAPVRIGSRWYIRAADLSATLMPAGPASNYPAADPCPVHRRGPGRPRKGSTPRGEVAVSGKEVRS